MLAGAAPVKLVEALRFSQIPRSSNGRTAAFGAVNRGSNPCRGANQLIQYFRGGDTLFCTDFVLRFRLDSWNCLNLQYRNGEHGFET